MPPDNNPYFWFAGKPLAARQALTRSEAVLQKSLDITEEADLALRNAMARIK
ncbi:phospholipase [Escherichia coli]|nr:phospholipase [Escherichia coli]